MTKEEKSAKAVKDIMTEAHQFIWDKVEEHLKDEPDQEIRMINKFLITGRIVNTLFALHFKKHLELANFVMSEAKRDFFEIENQS